MWSSSKKHQLILTLAPGPGVEPGSRGHKADALPLSYPHIPNLTPWTPCRTSCCRPFTHEDVTYKLAYQVHNLRPENEHVLGPLDVFPVDAAAAADWRNLLFGGWWSWLEKWGKLASIFIGVYYLYVAARRVITTLFSLKVLYEEHGFGPNLLWGLGPGQDVFPMQFLPPVEALQTTPFHQPGEEKIHKPRPRPLPHEYLTMEEVLAPSLPRRNPARPGVYPELPATQSDTDTHEKTIP